MHTKRDDSTGRDNGDQRKKEQDQQANATTIVPLNVRVDDAVQSETLLEFECDWAPGIGGSVWTSGEHYRSIFDGARVVELGSGTGYVGLMVAACFTPAHVHVSELRWGCLEQETGLLESVAATSDGADRDLEASPQVDVILGTDVAYLRELYDPLLHTMNRLPTSRTLILLGLNRTDTRLPFFRQLERDGFEYYKIPDFKLPQEFWGRDFGLFEIRRQD
ncbi:Methyltransferase-like protein 21E [Phytophthora pseudosyringae]|uniref:Methyltransferase-like protein 21E n=1 Tax=Phytophthora pseudosyringae TaxID=221518 RepID=A0A8T1VYR2_9STRA|nr:Methyltransferase-like protein 21E [Phytophthora pseudosyringae]